MTTNLPQDFSSYVPGNDSALVSATTLALIDAAVAADVVNRVWEAARDDAGLAQVVAPLVGSLADLPAFAVVVVDGGSARALVRGDLEVIAGQVRISGQGVATWREETLLGDPDAAWLDVTVARVGSSGGDELPVLAGVVRAGQATSRLDLRPASEPAATAGAEAGAETGGDVADQEQAEGDPDPAPEPAGTTESEPAIEVAVEPEAAVEPEIEGEPEVAVVPEIEGEAAIEGEPDAAVEPEIEPEAAIEEPVSESEPAVDSEAEVESEPEDLSSFEAEVEAADLDVVADVVPELAAELGLEFDVEAELAKASESPELAQPQTGAEPADEFDEIEDTLRPVPAEGGYGLVVPGRATALPPVPQVPEIAPVQLDTGAIAALDPAEVKGDHDGGTLLDHELAAQRDSGLVTVSPWARPQEEAKESRLHLSFSHGAIIDLERPVLIGRAPESREGLDAQLVTVPSPNQDISRTHCEIRIDGEDVLVTDLRSTNGTVVSRPGQVPHRLHPGEGTSASVGSRVDLGDGVVILVES